jgi:acyl dehydratase
MSWAVGMTFEPVEKPPITRELLAQYADASGDRNPVHLDDAFATSAGFPTVIVHGMLSMAFLADFVETQVAGSRYRVRRFKTRFRRVTFPGDALRCEGKVRQALPGGGWLVAVSAINQKGEVAVDGEAEVVP